ncbi:NAD(P)H-hydrate dehydratase [Rubellimicrobium thermophilum]
MAGPGGPDDLMAGIAALTAAGAVEVRIVAVDIPSGLCADSGRVLGREGRPAPEGRGVIPADLTVTFHSLKPGHLLADGPRLCGAVEVVPIGLPAADSPLALLEAPDPALLAKAGFGHKYSHGHALVLGGGRGRGGAARLAARGALRMGAGLVTLGVPPAALPENAARLDAVMLRVLADADALTAMLGDGRLNALCAGPGLGLGEREKALLAAVLEAGRPALLDADAITLLAGDEGLRARLHAGVVLTPHEGEFARLCPGIASRWRAPAIAGPAFSKLDAARQAAAELGCIVLLKGPDTVIADPGGRAAIHAAVRDRAVPWLATAGAGDVLAGMIAGLLARGLPPFEAASGAVWLHAEAARRFGPGLIAEDLPEALPGVFRALGL